ncbi:MAG: agmatine deiminase family protein, partial [Bacteroidetes bacterium]|nr:agmatine deiminase family protein [Bacteroidota bacterium]
MGAWDGSPAVKTDVNMEGGSIEVNGKGTLILCEAVTLQRNPKLSKTYIESEFRRVLGVSHIIWLKQGLAEDPLHFNQIYDKYYGWGTFGHTDEFVRFVNDSTLLLAWVDEAERNKHPINEMNYYRMKENLRILEQSRDQDGKRFKVIKVPLPDPIYLNTVIGRSRENNISGELPQWKVAQNWLPEKGLMNPGDSINWVAASSYLNYLVTNGAVLLPTYQKSGSSGEKEAKVRDIFSRVFPDRKLIFLDVLNLNYHGGGIHCITQQEPASPK